jgi:hypothetical protein
LWKDVLTVWVTAESRRENSVQLSKQTKMTRSSNGVMTSRIRLHQPWLKLARNGGRIWGGNPPLRLVTFDQFPPPDITYHRCLPCRQSWRNSMEDFAELMQRLLEIQSGGRQRSPELVAEDERLMDGLQERNLAGKRRQTAKFSQDSPELT